MRETYRRFRTLPLSARPEVGPSIRPQTLPSQSPFSTHQTPVLIGYDQPRPERRWRVGLLQQPIPPTYPDPSVPRRHHPCRLVPHPRLVLTSGGIRLPTGTGQKGLREVSLKKLLPWRVTTQLRGAYPSEGRESCLVCPSRRPRVHPPRNHRSTHHFLFRLSCPSDQGGPHRSAGAPRLRDQ